jgi:DNA-binding NarL/FixJ family response regulator
MATACSRRFAITKRPPTSRSFSSQPKARRLTFAGHEGADDYLTKPVVREDLLAAITARLERRQISEAQAKAGAGFAPDYTSPEPLKRLLGLTDREAEVLLWVSQGKSNGDIAVILGMAEKTVKKHMGNIFEKLGLEGRNAATVRALEVLNSPGRLQS